MHAQRLLTEKKNSTLQDTLNRLYNIRNIQAQMEKILLDILEMCKSKRK